MAWATPAATASWPVPRWVVPLTRFCRNRSWARFSNCRIRVIFWYRPRTVASSIAPRLVRVGDEQFLGREPGDDLDAVVDHHHLLLQPGGGDAVAGRAVGFQCENHALADLHRRVQRRQAADDGPLVQRQPQAKAELQAERGLLVRQADVLLGRPQP